MTVTDPTPDRPAPPPAGEPPDARAAATRSGTRTRSSTSSTCAPSSTATATASATSAGLTAKLDYLRTSASPRIWLLPFYPSPLRDDGYDIADYTERPPGLRHAARLPALHPRGARARPAGHHRAGLQPHLGPAPLVPARPPRPAGQRRRATSTSGATRPTATPTRASSSRTSRPRTGRGTRSPNAYYWHRFYSHQPDLNFDNPRGPARDLAGASTSGWRWASTACGSTPSRTSTSARARTARTCPRRTRSCRQLRAHIDEQLPRPHAAGRGQPVARGRRRLLRRTATSATWRSTSRVMPRMFMAHPHGGPLPDRRHPRRRRRRSRRTASGRSSCATTTS